MDNNTIRGNKSPYVSFLRDLRASHKWDLITHVDSAMWKATKCGGINWSCWEAIEKWMTHKIVELKQYKYFTKGSQVSGLHEEQQPMHQIQ
jgi:hypothetical protein